MSIEFKEKGNMFFKKGDYKNAKIYYTKGINIEPNEILYSNRSVCNLNLNLVQEALNDSNSAIQIKPIYFKGYYRKSEAYQKWGLFKEAISCIKDGLKAINKDDENSKDQLNKLYNEINVLINIKENFEKNFSDKEYKSSLSKLENLLTKATLDIELIKKKIFIQSILLDFDGANNTLNSNLSALKLDKDFFLIKSYIYYYQNKLADSRKVLSDGSISDPDNKKITKQLKKVKNLETWKEKGNNLVKEKKFKEAIEFYENALKVDPENKKFNSIVYANLSVCHKNLKNLELALKNANHSVKCDPTYAKGFFKKAEIEKEMKDYESAEHSYKQAATLDPATNYNYQLSEIAKLVKANKNKDFYKILGLEKNCTDADIKKAYKKLALKYHPDRNNQSEEQKLKAEKMFRQCNEAYSVLSDKNKRKQYDMGMYDENGGSGFSGFSGFGGNSGFGGHGGIDISDLLGGGMFNSFFQSGGSGMGGGSRRRQQGNTYHFQF